MDVHLYHSTEYQTAVFAHLLQSLRSFIAWIYREHKLYSVGKLDWHLTTSQSANGEAECEGPVTFTHWIKPVKPICSEAATRWELQNMSGFVSGGIKKLYVRLSCDYWNSWMAEARVVRFVQLVIFHHWKRSVIPELWSYDACWKLKRMLAKRQADLNRVLPKYVSYLNGARGTSWVAELPALFRVYGLGSRVIPSPIPTENKRAPEVVKWWNKLEFNKCISNGCR